MKVELKYNTMESGVQCVMIIGTLMMLLLYVNNLVTVVLLELLVMLNLVQDHLVAQYGWMMYLVLDQRLN